MTNNKQQTAVELLFQEMLEIQQSGKTLTFDENLALLEKYKEIHARQIISAYKAAMNLEAYIFTRFGTIHESQHYYNETYGGGEQ
jgi:hypothetical protein